MSCKFLLSFVPVVQKVHGKQIWVSYLQNKVREGVEQWLIETPQVG